MLLGYVMQADKRWRQRAGVAYVFLKFVYLSLNKEQPKDLPPSLSPSQETTQPISVIFLIFLFLRIY
jgi:hypothetical protein